MTSTEVFPLCTLQPRTSAEGWREGEGRSSHTEEFHMSRQQHFSTIRYGLERG